MDSHCHCTRKVRILNAMKWCAMAISSSHLLNDIVNCKLEYYEMDSGTLLIPPMLRHSHAFICVVIILDGKRVGGQGAYMHVEFDLTCKHVLTGCLKTRAPDSIPLSNSAKVTLHCTKLSYTGHVRPASDVGAVRDCSVCLDFSVMLTVNEIPTRHFIFKFERPVETRRPRVNAFIVILESRNSGNNHLPHVRVRSVMNAQDVLYNDLRQCLKDHGVGLSADLVASVGDVFLRHLTSALFPLGRNIWNCFVNDLQNRVGPAPNQIFAVFYIGRKVLGHKTDQPCLLTMAQNLQELWIGMGSLLEKR